LTAIEGGGSGKQAGNELPLSIVGELLGELMSPLKQALQPATKKGSTTQIRNAVRGKVPRGANLYGKDIPPSQFRWKGTTAILHPAIEQS
jgi:hypothetical protein